MLRGAILRLVFNIDEADTYRMTVAARYTVSLLRVRRSSNISRPRSLSEQQTSAQILARRQTL